MELIKLVNIELDSKEDGYGLKGLNLTVRAGDTYCICTDSAEHAHLLVKGMASLQIPKSGKVFFKETELSFTNQEALLAYKKNVGYVASDATLIKKASALDNLMLMQYYFENTVKTKMPEHVRTLCRLFDLEDKLDFYPWQLEPEENRLFVIIRELSKAPTVLLIERPGDYLRDETLEILKGVLEHWSETDRALVMFSARQDFVTSLCQKQINILKGEVTTSALQYCEYPTER
jgi:ABC-type methionine transport system ATPase subunit